MPAVVIKPFLGVRDGEVYPVQFAPGDIVEGDLAECFKASGIAVDENDERASQAAIVQDEIPADWLKMKWFALRALAAKILGKDVMEVANTEEARSIIQAEVDRRANPQPEKTEAVAGEGGDQTKSDGADEGNAGAGENGAGQGDQK